MVLLRLLHYSSEGTAKHHFVHLGRHRYGKANYDRILIDFSERTQGLL